MKGELPGGNVHCAILAVNTLHKALADYLLKTQTG
jgi:NifU-like protein involved in Fe-S cluster formation